MSRNKDSGDSELNIFRSKWKEDIENRKKAKQGSAERAGTFKDPGSRKGVLVSPAPASPVHHKRDQRSSHGAEGKVAQDGDGVAPAKADYKSALQVWEMAITNEKQGNLTQALTNYRKALKMDANVENEYRQIHFRRGKGSTNTAAVPRPEGEITLEDTDYARVLQTSHDYDPSHHNEEMSILNHFLQKSTINEEPRDPEEVCMIDLLPDEILVEVLTMTSLASTAAVSRLSRTCQRMYILLQTKKALWTRLSQQKYFDSLEWPGIAAKSQSTLEDELVQNYSSDWKRMYIEKPSVRYDGIYIATCTYMRPGSNEQSWNQPVHLVTYFRYLRLYRDGTCLSLLTTSEPKDTVHFIQADNPAGIRSLVTGTWSFSPSGALSIAVQGQPRYTFYLELQVKSTLRGKHNKLSWVGFWSVDGSNLDKTDFPFRASEKSFYFSKVRSYKNSA